MTDRDSLLAAVLACPDDDLPRLVFADWLEEYGETDRAGFIREQIDLERNPFDTKATERRAWAELTAKMSRLEKGDPQLRNRLTHDVHYRVILASDEFNRRVTKCKVAALRIGLREVRHRAIFAAPLTLLEEIKQEDMRQLWCVYRRGFPAEFNLPDAGLAADLMESHPVESLWFPGGLKVEFDPPDGQGWRAYFYEPRHDDPVDFGVWPSREAMVGEVEGWLEMRRAMA